MKKFLTNFVGAASSVAAVILFLTYSVVWAAPSLPDFFPKNIMQLDSKFAHHIILVEKSTHKLFLYSNQNGIPVKLAEYQIATGKNTGDKTSEGDEKTPEGVYQLNKFYTAKELNQMYGDMGKIYGSGAFVLSYPNIIDQRMNKTGKGIWLHSTNDESRIAKGLDSRGCVVVTDSDLKDIARYIDLENKTYIVTTETVDYWNAETWNKSREKLRGTIEQWIKAWSSTQINEYLSFYHPTLFKDQSGKDFKAWSIHKKNVFATAKNTSVNMSHLSLFTHDGLAYASFEQKYYSSLIRDTGRKYLVLQQDRNYDWKIIYEGWEDLAQEGEIAFTPSQRFFQ